MPDLSPILRPFGRRLWTPGQVKPTGIPEINWKHPLTFGLVTYWIDTGFGFYADLVNFRITTKTATGGTTGAGYTVTPWGTGFTFIATLSEQADPANAPNQAWTAPFSCACGFMKLGNSSGNFATLFGLNDAAGNNPWNFFVNSTATNTVGIAYGNGGSPFTFTTANNTFYVTVGSATGATAQSSWVNGVAQTSGTATSAVTVTNAHYTFNTNGSSYNNSGSPTFFNGSCFFGAAWLGRALTQADAALLYAEPYCFLVPPEPEMMIIQSTAVAAVSEEVHWSIYRPRSRGWGH